MKILMTADTVGGVWVYALELAHALGEHNVEIALATMGAALSREQRSEAAAIGNLEIFESAFKLEWMDDPWRDVEAAGDWLLGLAATIHPDVVHLNGYAHGALPWNVPLVMVGHSCVLSWWRSVKNEDAPRSWNRYSHEVRSGLQAADLVVAPTQAMLDELCHFYGPLPRAQVIFNARNEHLLAPQTKESFILAAGRLWDEAKNISGLAQAAAHLDWPVYVAGESRHPGGGEAQFANVHQLGRLSSEQVAGTLGRAAIYALPARYEPFGLSALEAALSGCALVLGDIPSLREVWGDAALFVPPDDNQALQNALCTLIHNAPRRAELAARAQERAQLFSPQKMAAEYLAAYRAVVPSIVPSVVPVGAGIP